MVQFQVFATAIESHKTGKSPREISSELDVAPLTVRNWIGLAKVPKLAHYLVAYFLLGNPTRGVWLPTTTSHGHAIPFGRFVEVPLAINKWQQVLHVIRQLDSDSVFSDDDARLYKFGFLLGMLIGDCSKSKKGHWHRHIDLTLSKKYESNLMIGEFTCSCAKGIGLPMKRMKDLAQAGKPNGFYVWISQSSPVIDWIMNVCIGLRDDELTTYNEVRMNWALTAPESFRLGILQGLAESDGSVSIAGQEVELWIGPSWDFGKALLETFGLRAFKNREAITLSRPQAVKAFEIPLFSPQLRTARYLRHETLARASKIPRGKRIQNEVRVAINELAERGMSNPKISEEIVARFGVLLSFEAIQRWGRPGQTPNRIKENSENNENDVDISTER